MIWKEGIIQMWEVEEEEELRQKQPSPDPTGSARLRLWEGSLGPRLSGKFNHTRINRYIHSHTHIRFNFLQWKASLFSSLPAPISRGGCNTRGKQAKQVACLGRDAALVATMLYLNVGASPSAPPPLIWPDRLRAVCMSSCQRKTKAGTRIDETLQF